MADCEELGARVEPLKALGNDAFEANMAISLIVAESYVCVCRRNKVVSAQRVRRRCVFQTSCCPRHPNQ